MAKFGRLHIILGVCFLMAATQGCRKFPKGGGSGGPDDLLSLDPINPDGIHSAGFDDPLSVRPGDDVIGQGGAFSPVYFGYDSSQISPTQVSTLEAVARDLKRSPGKSVIIEGHCDERGSREYNLSLGERRALAVRAYLIGLGVDSSRIHTKSFGEERPVNPGHNESAWSQNRRGEFLFY